MQSVCFVAIGELLVDVVAEGSGHSAHVRLAPGGSAFNAAATAAAAGADATVIGSVGDDPAGRMIVAELKARGIAANVTVADGATGVFLLSEQGISVDRGASREFPLPERIEADAVLVSGYLPPKTIALALARTDARWDALDAAGLETLPPGGNALFANAEAARRLTGAGPEEAVQTLGADYRLACVTCGDRGAVAVLDGHLHAADAAAGIAGNAPGAGDAFAAALLVALSSGARLDAALADASRWGARAAALSSPG